LLASLSSSPLGNLSTVFGYELELPLFVKSGTKNF
jgi:hypothetical protein